MSDVGFLVFWSILCGLLFGRCTQLVLSLYRNHERRKKYPSLYKASEKDLCKGPHDWQSIMLALTGLSPAVYKVCSTCGFVGQTNFRLNQPGLEVYKNSLKIRKEQEEKYSQSMRDRECAIKIFKHSLIKSYVAKFDGDLFENIKNLESFFSKIVMEVDVINHRTQKKVDQDGNSKHS